MTSTLLLSHWSMLGHSNKAHRTRRSRGRLPEPKVNRKHLARLIDPTKDGVPEFLEASSCMPLV